MNQEMAANARKQAAISGARQRALAHKQPEVVPENTEPTSHAWTEGARIGEATHPGPWPWQGDALRTVLPPLALSSNALRHGRRTREAGDDEPVEAMLRGYHRSGPVAIVPWGTSPAKRLGCTLARQSWEKHECIPVALAASRTLLRTSQETATYIPTPAHGSHGQMTPSTPPTPPQTIAFHLQANTNIEENRLGAVCPEIGPVLARHRSGCTEPGWCRPHQQTLKQ